MIMLSQQEIRNVLNQWYEDWNQHKLDGVMKLFHDDVIFDNWSGAKIQGKKALRRAWLPWFNNHNDFVFKEQETFIDEKEQKALFRWVLEWPSMENGFEGLPEFREGLDVLHFHDGKIIKKLTFSKTTLIINKRKIQLVANT